MAELLDSLRAFSWSRDSFRNGNSTIIILKFTISLAIPTFEKCEVLAVSDGLAGGLASFW
jgi:hypothetical protein